MGVTDTLIEPADPVAQLRSVILAVAPKALVLFTVIVSSVIKTALGSAQELYLVLTTNLSEFAERQIFGKLKPILPGTANEVVAVATNEPPSVNNCELINLVAPPEGTKR